MGSLSKNIKGQDIKGQVEVPRTLVLVSLTFESIYWRISMQRNPSSTNQPDRGGPEFRGRICANAASAVTVSSSAHLSLAYSDNTTAVFSNIQCDREENFAIWYQGFCGSAIISSPRTRIFADNQRTLFKEASALFAHKGAHLRP